MAGLILGIAGLAVSIGTTAMSFSEKAKQEKRSRAIGAKAQKMMDEARDKLKINFADALSINKEPYEREREAMLSAGAQVMEQAMESERGGGATAGRVLAAQQEGQGQIRDKMSQDLFNLEAAQAEEDSRLRDINVQMDLGEVEGAQAAAAAAENAANIAQQQGVQGISNVAQQGLAMVPLYQKTGGVRAANKLGRQAKRAGKDVQSTIMAGSVTQDATGTAAGSDYVPEKTIWGQGTANEYDISGYANAQSDIQRRDWLAQNEAFTRGITF